MNLPFKIPCVILAGGKSSRMGEDKALLPFDSSNSLIQYQYERLKPYFKEVYISSKIDKFDFPAKIIFDKGKEFSPIVALETIFENIDSDKLFIITVDTPLVSLNSIEKIINQAKDYDILVAKTEKIHNLCGVFDKKVLSQIKKMLNDDIHKVGFLLKNVNSFALNFEDENEFINLNNKEEYQRAKLLIR